MNNLNTWSQKNDNFLSVAVEWLRLRLIRLAEEREEAKTTVNEVALQRLAKEMEVAASTEPLPALTSLSRRLGLSAFEQQVLLLSIAIELDEHIAALCGQAQGNTRRPYPTFLLAFALFNHSSWDILSPERPLRYWRLIEINQPAERPLTTSPIRADERVVSYVKGLNYLDDRLKPFLFAVKSKLEEVELPPSQQERVNQVEDTLRKAPANEPFPVIQLVGIDKESKQLIAQHAAAALGLQLYRLSAELLPSQTLELETFIRLWERESLLLPLALHIDAHEIDSQESNQEKSLLIRRFLMRSSGIFFLDTRDVWIGLERKTHRIDISKPTAAEQEAAWRDRLDRREGTEKGIPAQLAAQFNLSISTIDQIARERLADRAKSEETQEERLWDSCLVQTRPRMDMLAQRITPKATWKDIVLPDQQLNLLQRIVEQVAQRGTVYEKWGFRKRTSRGLGMSVLFAGESGTGKTMAAEILANHLRLNLYRIDLSAVVSKYIGETEKNLRKLFDAAEDGGAILFFDEADALFGKRSQVKDSHDRYANIEVNYLLQRIEAYQGLAILATNLKSSLDDAFMRRLRFVVTFPFPDKHHRQQIWQRIFPSETPIGDLDYRRLAKFKLPGGSIYNIALNAAFLAAKAGTSVTMPDALRATRMEFYKQDRLVNERDFMWEGKSV